LSKNDTLMQMQPLRGCSRTTEPWGHAFRLSETNGPCPRCTSVGTHTASPSQCLCCTPTQTPSDAVACVTRVPVLAKTALQHAQNDQQCPPCRASAGAVNTGPTLDALSLHEQAMTSPRLAACKVVARHIQWPQRQKSDSMWSSPATTDSNKQWQQPGCYDAWARGHTLMSRGHNMHALQMVDGVAYAQCNRHNAGTSRLWRWPRSSNLLPKRDPQLQYPPAQLAKRKLESDCIKTQKGSC
jgi:hypothetical protein